MLNTTDVIIVPINAAKTSLRFMPSLSLSFDFQSVIFGQ